MTKFHTQRFLGKMLLLFLMQFFEREYGADSWAEPAPYEAGAGCQLQPGSDGQDWI